MKKLTSLDDLLTHSLQDLYSAENQILEALPTMAEAATAPELKSAFDEHLEQTQQHVARLRQVMSSLGVEPDDTECQAMKGLIEEGEELMEEDADPAVMDAALIGAAQKVEHYEIASYGCAVTWARLLGAQQATTLLLQTLEEEKLTDTKLTLIAESGANIEAAEA